MVTYIRILHRTLPKMDVHFERRVLENAIQHIMFHRLERLFNESMDDWRESKVVEGMSSSIPGACVSYNDFLPDFPTDDRVFNRWKKSYDTDTWPISNTLRAITVEARLSLGLAREVIAESPKAILSLAKTTATFAKYQYKEWRNPRIRYNVYHLPDEILADIVEFAIASESLESQPLAAVPLSHVSRRFRVVVLGLPKLWTIISTDTSLKLCKEALKRSKKQRLDILCKCLGSSVGLFNLARNHSPRWKSFTLVVGIGPHVHSLPILRGIRALDLPNLERLSFVYRLPTHSGYKTVENNIHCYGKLRCPKLTHLEFVNVVPKSLPRNARFTITKLSLVFVSCWNYQFEDAREHSWNWARLLRFLADTKTVTELDLVLRVHELDAVVLPPTELPHIMKLSLRIEDTLEHVVDPFLRALRLPNLRAFTFELAFSAEEHDDEEEDEDDQYIIDPWTRETCAVNLFLSALFVPEEHFRHLTDLSLDIQVEPAFIKDNFRIPFHRLPMLERLHVRTNRNVFAPKPHQVYTIPSDGLHLKELRLTNCEYMKNLTWIRTLSEYVDQRCLEQVVVEGELGTSRGTMESLERFFPREKIQVQQSNEVCREVCQYSEYLCE